MSVLTKGILKDIIDIVSSDFELNIKSINIETKRNVFTGVMMLYIENVNTLNNLIENLSKIDNIEQVTRIGF